MLRHSFALALAGAFAGAACGGRAAPVAPPTTVPAELDGPHRAAIHAYVKPYLDGEIVEAMVIGVYDAGSLEIYGFGRGPGGKPPDGRTLFDLGSVTKVYTGLLLADAVQRREVELDQPLADLLPRGVTVPTADKTAITLRHLVLHSSGLPRLPPTVAARLASPDPYGEYSEDVLYADLVRTELEAAPGTRVSYSNYGAALLGFALGRKVGGGYGAVLRARVLEPLGLRDTFVTVPASHAARRAAGTDTDLRPAAPWTFPDTLAGAGALISSANDQLKFIEAQLDAAAGGRAKLRGAMRFAQEAQLEGDDAANQGLGWQIDTGGRLWHNGQTAGAHAFVGFEPKTRRGVVVLASTATTLADRIAIAVFDIMAKQDPTALVLPAAGELAAYAGTYDVAGTPVTVAVAGKRLYVEGAGEPRQRLVPVAANAFWIEGLHAPVSFVKDESSGAIVQMVFDIGGSRFIAPRAEAK